MSRANKIFEQMEIMNKMIEITVADESNPIRTKMALFLSAIDRSCHSIRIGIVVVGGGVGVVYGVV
jgi:hypothetical protein